MSLAFLDNKQDYYVINNLTYALFTSLNNLSLQFNAIQGVINSKIASIGSSVTFLKTSLAEVIASQQSLDIIESRINTIEDGLEFVLKTRLETNENFKSISLVDLSKGSFDGMMYDIGLRGLTFDKVRGITNV